ncbi:DNA helicase [Chamberlinius hualienensis]
MDKENTGCEYDALSVDLQCPVTIENINPDGSVGKRTVHKKAVLSLARNQFRDLILVLSSDRDRQSYVLCNVILHAKFIKDGKATIVVDNKIRFFVSNCALDKLIVFLKTVSGKLKNKPQNAPSGRSEIKKRLMSVKKTALTEISPLTNNEIISSKRPADVQTTPTGIKKMRTDRSELDIKQRRLEVSRPLSQCDLTEEQKMVLNAISSGRNIFFTGSAGTGKTHLLKKIIRVLPPATTFVTASTGVAAMQIGGVTLHSFAGIGAGSADLETTLSKLKANNVVQHWKKCQHLVVDEISMIQGEYFEKLEHIARIVRKNQRPFGGIQLILCGDFLQLPPVTRKNEKRTFCFETTAWQQCLAINMELKEVHRQRDKKLITLLQSIRMGVCTNEMASTLLSTSRNKLEEDGILATNLCTHNDDVSQINLERLANLPGESHVFTSTDSDPCLSSWLDQQCPVESKLILKIGTQVMLLKNLDFQQRLVNGSRGIVVGFNELNGLPLVKFKSGVKLTVSPHLWTVKTNGGLQISRRQLPIKLAWALSIHKAQGMTLDCVEMSLSKVFECGQAYVGLSRASTLKGLKVLDFDTRCVRADPVVIKFYKCLKAMKR